VRRRPQIKNALIAAFLARMEIVMATYAPMCVQYGQDKLAFD
jgi:hypothetical protein